MEGDEEVKRYDQVRLPVKKYDRRRSSQVHRGNLVESLIDEKSDEEEDYGTTCKIYKIPWVKLTEKCGDWFQCNICEEYIWPKCYDKRNISADKDIVCNICIGSRFLRFRNTRPEVFCKKIVLENFIKFTGKDLRQSFFFNKVAGPATLFLKKDSGAQVLLL